MTFMESTALWMIMSISTLSRSGNSLQVKCYYNTVIDCTYADLTYHNVSPKSSNKIRSIIATPVHTTNVVYQ